MRFLNADTLECVRIFILGNGLGVFCKTVFNRRCETALVAGAVWAVGF